MDLVLDCASPQALENFWSSALGYKALWSSDDLVVLVPEDEVRPPLLLQRVPEIGAEAVGLGACLEGVSLVTPVDPPLHEVAAGVQSADFGKIEQHG